VPLLLQEKVLRKSGIFLKKGSVFQFTKIHIPVDGLIKLSGIKEIIKKEIPFDHIEDLPVPFYICVSNLSKGTVEYHNSGLLGDAVHASSSIPVLFSPVKMGGNLYVDGGLMDNVPVEPIKHDCENIIVSNISPINTDTKLSNMLQIAMRTFYMSVNQNLEKVKKQATCYIEPHGISKYEIFSRKHADELYELGYNSTIKAIENH
jgi:NTE family protein